MNYIDLFSGEGGFPFGGEAAGMEFENHYYSEIDPAACELYAIRFPDAIPLGDITKHEEWNLARGEYIITGGFPCIDISVAGRQEGITGVRSGLWFEMLEVIRRVRPRFVIVENVGALTSAKRIECLLVQVVGVLFGQTRLGRALTLRLQPPIIDVLAGLAEVGYDAEWQDIRASDMGLPHKRERIWVVAYPSSSGRRENEPSVWQRVFDADRSSEDVADAGGVRGSESPGAGSDEGAERNEPRGSGQEMAHTECESFELRGGPGPVPEAQSRNEQEREIDPGGTSSGGGRANVSDSTTTKERSRHGETREREPDATVRSGNGSCHVSDPVSVYDDDTGSGTGQICGERSETAEILRGDSAAESRRPTQRGLGGWFDGVSAWLDGSWEYGLPRVAQAQKNRVARLRMAGNAIVPQIAYLLFLRIKELLSLDI